MNLDGHMRSQAEEEKTADIAAKIFNTELYKSSIDEVRFNASDREEINITIR